MLPLCHAYRGGPRGLFSPVGDEVHMNTHVINRGMFRFAALSAVGLAALAGCGGDPTSESAELQTSLEEAAAPGEGQRSPWCPGCAPPFAERPGEIEFSGELIVKPIQGAPLEGAKRARERLISDTITYYPEVDEYVIRLPARFRGAERGVGENLLAAELMATGDYEYVTPNWLCNLSTTPNDPLFGSQWHHTKIQSPAAWDVQPGTSSLILAFTDTGIDVNHPDLAANRVPGYNSASQLDESSGGDITDIHGHGTHVAGCAAAIGNNGVGVSGVANGFKIMMVRVTNSSNGNAALDDITAGARWAAEHGARIVSSSYSGVSSPSVGTTGTYIKSLGGLYLFAAGNDGQNLNWFDHADVVVVGASTQADARASFSGYGRAIDVFAPGVSILSTTVNGAYAAWNGTSMATPIANGVAGMILSVDPSFTPAQVEGFLTSSCDDIGAPGEDSTFGWGRVNVFKGVQAARAVACTHDICAAGARLGSGCDPCARDICYLDPFCCNTEWDAICVDEVAMVCGSSCS
jgi:subtilisin family serine protease